MSHGTLSPYRAKIPGTWEVRGVWSGGGAAANCTVASGDWNAGITSVAYNAATGKYLITFKDFGQQIVGGSVEVVGDSGDIPMKAHLLRDTYSASAGTVEFELWTLATEAVAAALTDAPADHKLMVHVVFADNAPNS